MSDELVSDARLRTAFRIVLGFFLVGPPIGMLTFAALALLTKAADCIAVGCGPWSSNFFDYLAAPFIFTFMAVWFLVGSFVVGGLQAVVVGLLTALVWLVTNRLSVLICAAITVSALLIAYLIVGAGRVVWALHPLTVLQWATVHVVGAIGACLFCQRLLADAKNEPQFRRLFGHF